ncbi:MAG: hypothetical protein EA402_02605 [Planctomycetota bacterium]|nr:MAG: hypothetical protein EA402_02605 [Planctomycetota bacterium]
MRRRPWFYAPWDGRSDQPQVIGDRRLKRQLRLQAWPEHLKVAATLAALGPTLAGAYLWPGLRLRRPSSLADMLGIGVSPHPWLDRLLAQLPLRHCLIRLPLRRGDEQQAVLATIARHPDRDWLVVICQDRELICRPQAWRPAWQRLLGMLPPQVRALQLGNAVNRFKWGCVHIGEYLDWCEAWIPDLRRLRPDLMVCGSSVIDFEPHLSLRSLINGYSHRFDAVSALLYVDRRGAPENRQYGFFDSAAKIRSLAAMVAAAPRQGKRLWITEVNWPLRGQAGWAPTSEVECVDESAAADYLRRYCLTAFASGLVERVYPWQLIARGYGLVDDCGSEPHYRPAFTVLQQLVQAPVPPGDVSQT